MKKTVRGERTIGRRSQVPSPKLALLLQEAIALHQHGQLSEAETRYQQILSADPKHADALHFLGLVKRANGDLQQAHALLSKAASINPSNVIIFASLGNVLHDQGMHADAICSYDRLLNAMPDFAEVLNNKGNALSALGRYDDALLCYQRALQAQSEFPDAYFNRGNVYMSLRRYEAALNDYERVLQVNPAHFQAWNNRGNALQKLERLQEALGSYLQGLAVAPENAELHASIGNAYKKCGNLQAATKHFAKTLELEKGGFTRQNAAMQLAILHYVYGDPGHVAPLLQIAKDMLADANVQDRGSQIYCLFMLQIHRWWMESRHRSLSRQADGVLYVIGESHMLSTQHTVVQYRHQHWQCKGFWLEAATQWRIGSQENNHYQQLLSAWLGAIPDGSNVLITIGEIDCRIDGGIWKAHTKSPEIQIEQRIENVIKHYLDYLHSLISARRLQLIISGIPACNLQGSNHDEDEVLRFCHFLNMFNCSLKNQALQMGMDFLDVFSMTDNGKGKSNQRWHVDAHHLSPDGVVEAFDHYLVLS